MYQVLDALYRLIRHGSGRLIAADDFKRDLPLI
jgi:hypothetical protein